MHDRKVGATGRNRTQRHSTNNVIVTARCAKVSLQETIEIDLTARGC